MHSNYQWQKHQTDERIQQRLQESQRHRLANQQQDTQPHESTARSILRLPLRLVTAVLRIGSY
jgi:hypothetical protein